MVLCSGKRYERGRIFNLSFIVTAEGGECITGDNPGLIPVYWFVKIKTPAWLSKIC